MLPSIIIAILLLLSLTWSSATIIAISTQPVRVRR